MRKLIKWMEAACLFDALRPVLVQCALDLRHRLVAQINERCATEGDRESDGIGFLTNVVN